MSAPGVARAAQVAIPPLGAMWGAAEIFDHYDELGAMGIAAYVALCRLADPETDECEVDAKALAGVLKITREYAAKMLRLLAKVDAVECLKRDRRLFYRVRRRDKRPAGKVRASSGNIVPDRSAGTGTIVPATHQEARTGNIVPDQRPGGKEVLLCSSKSKTALPSPYPLPSQKPENPGNGANPTASPPGSDSRHARLYRWIKFRWEEANAPEKLPWADECDMDVQLKASLRGTFADRRVWDEELLKRCVEYRFASDLGPKRREPPARWISKLWEYRDGPLNKYGKPKVDDEVITDGHATAGRTVPAAMRRNATVARTISNFHQTAAAIRYLQDEARREAGGDAGTGTTGKPDERHDRARPGDRHGPGARGREPARAGSGV